MLSLSCCNLSELPQVAQAIIGFTNDRDNIWLLEGEMGAGKTTLAKEICTLMGVQELVSSPTFSLVNQYQGKDKTIYHFDFYRIEDLEEVMDMGYEEYFFDPNAICLIEWSSKILPLLPLEVLKIEIRSDDGLRHFTITRNE